MELVGLRVKFTVMEQLAGSESVAAGQSNAPITLPVSVSAVMTKSPPAAMETAPSNPRSKFGRCAPTATSTVPVPATVAWRMSA